MPNGVMEIGSSVFLGCNSLKKIYCEAESEPKWWDKDWLGDCEAEVVWGYKGE